MTYEVVFDNEALYFLKKLDKHLRKRIFNKIVSAKEGPLHFFERMKGRTDYKLMVGDYRVIADITNNPKRIEITLVGHRKKVYKRLKLLKK